MKFFKIVKEYLLNSTLHGFHFIAEVNYHWTERVFWLICCVLSWIGSALLIKSSWENFQNNAISFVVETSYLGADTKFPRITTCEDDYQMVRVYDVALKLYGPDHDCNLDEVLKEIGYFHGSAYYIKEFCFTEDIECPKSKYFEVAKKIRSTCEEMFVLCKWRGKPFDCCQHFLPLSTEFGVCYSLSPKHESNTDSKKEFLKLYSNLVDGLGSLFIEMNGMAKIYMHSENDFPYYNTMTTDIVDVQPNIFKKITISVTGIENEYEVHQLSIKQRKCRFPYENDLQVSKQYSYSACITECRRNEQLKLCNCTSHLMPYTTPEEQCGIDGIVCLNDHYSILAGPKTKWSSKPGLSCNCLPGCDEPEFSIITSSGVGIESNSSIMEIVMDRLPSERYKRNVVRGRLDLIVSMGGAAGLFVGASILSFIEIFYYFTLRYCGVTTKIKHETNYIDQKGRNHLLNIRRINVIGNKNN